jgi:hypothetical protein
MNQIRAELEDEDGIQRVRLAVSVDVSILRAGQRAQQTGAEL